MANKTTRTLLFGSLVVLASFFASATGVNANNVVGENDQALGPVGSAPLGSFVNPEGDEAAAEGQGQCMSYEAFSDRMVRGGYSLNYEVKSVGPSVSYVLYVDSQRHFREFTIEDNHNAANGVCEVSDPANANATLDDIDNPIEVIPAGMTTTSAKFNERLPEEEVEPDQPGSQTIQATKVDMPTTRVDLGMSVQDLLTISQKSLWLKRP